jgi:RHS repeat-associated protein
VNVTAGGVTTTYADTTQVLNTGGFDAACLGNESHPWTRVGGGGAAINVPLPPAVALSLTPTTITGDLVGQTQRMTVAALDGSGHAVPSLLVTLSISGANPQPLQGTTDAAGVVTFSYTGVSGGIDTMTASAFVSGLQAVSNQVTLSWNVPVPAPSLPPPAGTAPPSISNLSPLDGTTVIKATPISASITPVPGSTIASWSVTDRLLPGGPVENLGSTSGTPPATLASFDPSTHSAGTYAIVISATSSAGGSSSAVTRVIVGAGGGGSIAQTPPSIAPATPADGTVVTAPTAVSAGITPPASQSIASWTVTLTPATGGRAITIGSGTGAPPATLATLDPTLLPNGNYVLAVTATASGGGTETQTTAVAVTGVLKPGRFVTTYQDLSVPVAGMVMQVRRTYDSYDGRMGDFGTGWRVELSNVTVTANRPLGAGGWSATPTNCVYGLCYYAFRTTLPHEVTVAYADGHADVFDLTPLNGGPVSYWAGTAAYTPRPGGGTSSSLAPDPASASFIYGFDGNLYDDAGNFYDPQRFQLTTRDGRVLTLDRTLGLVAETDPSGNAITVDANGLHSTAGPSIIFSRDAGHGNRIVQITGPADGVAGQSQHFVYGYDAGGNLATVTDPNGNTVSYGYDASTGKLKGSNDPAGQPIQTLTYGPDGRLTSIANGNQPPTIISTAPGAMQQVVLDANGKLTTVYVFNARGNVIEKDQTFSGHTVVTRAQYDQAGRTTDLTDPLGHQHWVYDETATSSNGNLLSYTDTAGRTWQYTNYDAHGHAATIVGPDGVTIATLAYDPKTGLLLSTKQPGLPASTYTYYPNGLRKTAIDPDGRTTAYTYNAAGFKMSSADSLGRAIQYTPDAAGRVVAVADQLGNVTRYGYDGMGQLTTITDPTLVTRTSHYNARGLLDQAGDGVRTTSYVYNDLGLVAQRTDRNGAITTYTYDVHGKLVQEVRPNNDVTTYRYDPLERLVEADNASGEITFAYDNAGNLAAQTSCAPQPNGAACVTSAPAAPQPTVQLAYTYAADGEALSVTGPDGTTGYGYDADGRLSSVSDAGHRSTVLRYDGDSRLTGFTLPNGIVDTLAYDAAGQLIGHLASSSGTPVSRADYTIDPVTARRTSLTDLDGTHTFTYQDNGWLQSATHPSASGLAAETYAYDGAGNRTSWAGVPASSVTYAAPERLASAGTAVFTYDGEGNLITRTTSGAAASTVYHWNADHRLLRIDYPTGGVSTYKYDPLGRRIESNDNGTITRYIWDAFNVHADYDANNNLLAAYTLTPTGAGSAAAASPAVVLEATRGGAPSFYLHDGINSTVATTDASGAVTARYRYDSFGRPGLGNGSEARYTYAASQYDAASGLYYMRDRYYDPSTGRLLSEDPVAATYYNVPLERWTHADPTLDVTLPSTLNRYMYVGNDPVDFTDPSGDGVFWNLFRGFCLGALLRWGSFTSVGTPWQALVAAAVDCLAQWAWDEEQLVVRRALVAILISDASTGVAVAAGTAARFTVTVIVEIEADVFLVIQIEVY